MTNSLNEFLVSSDNDQELILLGPGNIKIPDKRELDKITELGKIKVMCYTWNVAERNQGSINAIIHSFSSIDIDDRPNIISIALQELPPSDKTFHINLVKQLTEAFKTTHYILSWVRRWSQMQIVIVKNNLKNFILSFSYKWIPSKYVSKPIRTKGCITIFIKILHLSCAFISCHFSHKSAMERNKNSNKFYEMLIKDKELTQTIDCYFLFGDLNYRLKLNWDNELCKKIVNHSLLSGSTKQRIIDMFYNEYDELYSEMSKNEILKGFKEPKITFLPTYKYIPFTDKYNKNRTLAYTDRVLYMGKGKNLIAPYRYDSLHLCKISDHKPVYAIFTLNLY